MRTLHVAAMPFPSHQGTQALLHEMLGAFTDAGHDTHLLCYPHAGFARATRYTVHRGDDVARDRSLRSGPSLRKVLQDLQLVRDLRRLHRTLRPARVIAHHVEAALAAHAARVPAVTYVAHTSLAAELPSYFAGPLRSLWVGAGRALDWGAALSTARRFAISPLLQRRLSRDTGQRFELLVPPWRPESPMADGERVEARQHFGLSAADEVVLYAGNLDGYQGLESLCTGLERAARRRPRLRFLLGTSSAARDFIARRSTTLRAVTRCIPLDSELTRRRLHAACDLALVPRLSPGGLPVKLLDALARGVPVLTCERATAGFAFGDACTVLVDDRPPAWASAITAHFHLSSQHRRACAESARRIVQLGHAPDACVKALLADPDRG